MGVVKKLLLKIEELSNKIEILEGRFDKLKINIDLINSKPKELPDALTYKPQQPYMGLGRDGDVTLTLVYEGNMDVKAHVEGSYTWFKKEVDVSGYDFTKTSFICEVVTSIALSFPIPHVQDYQIISNNILYIDKMIYHTNLYVGSAVLRVWALTKV